jgi:hypothetical protein
MTHYAKGVDKQVVNTRTRSDRRHRPLHRHPGPPRSRQPHPNGAGRPDIATPDHPGHVSPIRTGLDGPRDGDGYLARARGDGASPRRGAHRPLPRRAQAELAHSLFQRRRVGQPAGRRLRAGHATAAAPPAADCAAARSVVTMGSHLAKGRRFALLTVAPAGRAAVSASSARTSGRASSRRSDSQWSGDRQPRNPRTDKGNAVPSWR